MLELTCPSCKKTLVLNSVDTIEETYGATMDCKNLDCNELLISHEEQGVLPFHEYMNAQEPSWPKDGKGTGYVDI